MESAMPPRRLRPLKPEPKPSILPTESESSASSGESAGAPAIAPAETIPRLTIPLTPDGAPLWDRMRDETKGKVKAFLRDHAPRGEEAAGASSSFDPLVVHALYDALGSLAVVAAIASGHTRASSEQMKLTIEEKQILTPATQKVLDKYGASISRYQDECALALVLFAVYQAKIAKLEKQPRPGVVQAFAPVAIEREPS